MKISKSHSEFIRLVVSGETQTNAYKQAISKGKASKAILEQGGSRIAKKYTKQITELKQKSQKIVEQANDSKEAKIALKSILTQAEVDSELCKIIKGESLVQKIVIVAGKLEVIDYCKPDHSDKLKAIDLYNKRFGSNEAIKTDITSGGNAIGMEAIIFKTKRRESND